MGLSHVRTSRSTRRLFRRRCCAWPARSRTGCCCGLCPRTMSATWSCRKSVPDGRRAGKSLEGFEVLPAIPSAVGGDRDRGSTASATSCTATSACRSTGPCSRQPDSRRTRGVRAASPDLEAQKLAISERSSSSCARSEMRTRSRRGRALPRGGRHQSRPHRDLDSDFEPTLRAAASAAIYEPSVT